MLDYTDLTSAQRSVKHTVGADVLPTNAQYLNVGYWSGNHWK